MVVSAIFVEQITLIRAKEELCADHCILGEYFGIAANIYDLGLVKCGLATPLHMNLFSLVKIA